MTDLFCLSLADVAVRAFFLFLLLARNVVVRMCIDVFNIHSLDSDKIEYWVGVFGF